MIFDNIIIKFQRLTLMAVALFCFSCSPRYMKYKRAVRQLKEGSISLEQFDARFYTLYDTKVFTSTTDSLKINLRGCYVSGTAQGFKVLKLAADGRALITARMSEYPSNLSLLNMNTSRYYYRVHEGRVFFEYLQSRDWNLYNIIISGRVHGDSIIFEERENITIDWTPKTKLEEIYVLDTSLLVSPM